MLNNGIVAIGDICNNDLALSVKRNERLHYYNYIGVCALDPGITNKRFERSKLIYDKYIANRKKTSLTPHAPYSVSYPLWEKITPYFSGKIISIHTQEPRTEDDFFLRGPGE